MLAYLDESTPHPSSLLKQGSPICYWPGSDRAARMTADYWKGKKGDCRQEENLRE